MNATRLDEVWLVIDPTFGVEIQRTRPSLIVSPDEMNRHLRTVVIAPMTTVQRLYLTRVAVTFQGKHGQVALDPTPRRGSSAPRSKTGEGVG